MEVVLHFILFRIILIVNLNTKKHMVFVFTDGYGDNVKIKEPKKWHWFIEGGDWCMRQAKCLSDKIVIFIQWKTLSNIDN